MKSAETLSFSLSFILLIFNNKSSKEKRAFNKERPRKSTLNHLFIYICRKVNRAQNLVISNHTPFHCISAITRWCDDIQTES